MSLCPAPPSPRLNRRPSRVPAASLPVALLVAVVFLGSSCAGSGLPASASAVRRDAATPGSGSGSVAELSPSSGTRADECRALMNLVNATLLTALPDETATAADRAELDDWLDDLWARAPRGFEGDLDAMEAAIATQVEALAELHRDAASTGTWPDGTEVSRLLADGTHAFDEAGARVMAWIETECGPDVLGAAGEGVSGA